MQREIPLGRTGRVAIVDEADYEALSQHRWQYSSCGRVNGYAMRPALGPDGKKRVAYMHRLLMDAPTGMMVDHINGNTLDNRRENLRLVDGFQNKWNQNRFKNNKSGYTGVYRMETPRKGVRWVATIRYNGKVHRIGYFQTPEAAARAYNEVALRERGEHARLNVIQSEWA